MKPYGLLPGTRRLLLFSFLALVPFQDTVLRHSLLGYIGSSAAILPLSGLLLLDLLDWPKLKAARLQLPVLASLSYAALICLVSLLIYGTMWQEVDLLAKTAVLFACLAIALYSVMGVNYADQACLRWGCRIGFAFCLAGIALGDLNLFGLDFLVRNPILHAGLEAGERWRGLSTEASTLSVTVVSLGLLCAVLAGTTPARMLYLFVSFGALVMTYSKGGIATLCIAIGVMVALQPRLLIRVLAATVLFSPLLLLAWANWQSITTDELLSETTTLATRSVLTVWSADVVLDHPFGVGFSGFYPALTAYLPGAMDAVFRWSPFPLNFSEVAEYRQTSQFASTKSLLLNYAVYFGAPAGLAILFAAARGVRFLSRRREFLLCVALLFVTIALCTYIESPFLFAPSVIVGLAWHKYANA